MSEKVIYVYDDFTVGTSVLMGMLYVNSIRGEETYSFEYNKDWLIENNASTFLDPNISYFLGRQYPMDNNMFGMFSDASPDRWGRTLMQKRERIRAEREERKPNKLNASDYLIGVYDETRMGGLRFKGRQEGPFVSTDEELAIVPWANLRTLEEAARKVEKDEDGLSDKWISQLLRPGSSLGGARPKATVIDPSGGLWIAKFPSKNDENDTGAWEKVASDLARKCGLNVPESKLEKFSNNGSTFLVKRFDRQNGKRIHFASAMTLLRKTDGASATDGTSYLDLASFIKSYGANPQKDLIELWKRIVFSMAITNIDDHLRNHAFIYKRNGWELSPMFDVNPVPYGNGLALNVDESDNRISIKLAIDTASRFGIPKADAEEIAKGIVKVVIEGWQSLAIKHGLTNSQRQQMSPAFIKE